MLIPAKREERGNPELESKILSLSSQIFFDNAVGPVDNSTESRLESTARFIVRDGLLVVNFCISPR